MGRKLHPSWHFYSVWSFRLQAWIIKLVIYNAEASRNSLKDSQSKSFAKGTGKGMTKVKKAFIYSTILKHSERISSSFLTKSSMFMPWNPKTARLWRPPWYTRLTRVCHETLPSWLYLTLGAFTWTGAPLMLCLKKLAFIMLFLTMYYFLVYSLFKAK